MKAESWNIRFRGKCDAMRAKTSRFFELARVLMRFDDVAHFIVNVDHAVMRTVKNLAIGDRGAYCV
jgi:hypothetical protein